MKTHRVSLQFGSLLLLSTINLLADGLVNFNNAGAPPEKRIYVGEYIWSGTEPQFVSWQGCAGSAYHISLHWGPAGTTDDQFLIQHGPAAIFQTGAAAGTFLGGARTIFSPHAGPVLSFQVRAWSGTAATYDQAIANPEGTGGWTVGKGPIFELKTKDPANDMEFTPNIDDAPGWRGFIMGAGLGSAVIIPEPSTIALCLLGASALLCLRRRR